MERLNLATYAKEIKSDYDSVVNGDLTYVVFTTLKDSSLKPTAQGNGDITEFVSEFEEGSVQYGIISVNPYGSDVKKLLLVGWCPDSAPLKSKVSYASNVAEVGKILHYHVQVTARDFDDLDVKDLLKTVSDASGARYSIQSVAKSTPPVQSFKPKPKSASPQPEPVQAKPTPIIKPKPASKLATKADEWDGEEEIEERDFSEKPLENVAPAYKPTKVDITALRKGTDNSTSSTPSKPIAKEEKKEDPEPVLFKDRMTAYVSLNSDDGRLSSLPKPKVSNAVSSRYQEKVVQPEFGKSSKVPVYDSYAAPDKSKLVGGASRAFGTENGRTPAEVWAEKHGKFKEVAHDEKPVNADEVESEKPVTSSVSNVQSKLSTLNVKDDDEEEEEDNDDDWEEEPKKPSLPTRSLPPPPKKVESEPEEASESEPEPEPESEPEKEEEPAPTPAAAAVTDAPSSGKKALVEYEYEKDEDNEISLVEGELIVNIRFVDEDWWFGENSKGESGLFPASYVVLKEEEEEEEKEEARATPPLPARSEPAKKEGPSAVAEYDYDATEDNELTFKEGDLITDIEMVDEDWWLGNLNGERKLFPSNHVTLNE